MLYHTARRHRSFGLNEGLLGDWRGDRLSVRDCCTILKIGRFSAMWILEAQGRLATAALSLRRLIRRPARQAHFRCFALLASEPAIAKRDGMWRRISEKLLLGDALFGLSNRRPANQQSCVETQLIATGMCRGPNEDYAPGVPPVPALPEP